MKEYSDVHAKSRTVSLDKEMYSGVLTGSGTWGMVLVVVERRWELWQSLRRTIWGMMGWSVWPQSTGRLYCESSQKLCLALHPGTWMVRAQLGTVTQIYQGPITCDQPHWHHFLMRWAAEDERRGMKVSSPGERQTLLGCKSRGSTDPLVLEIQSCSCCSRGPGDPTVQSNKGTRSLATSRSHMGHICSLQSLPKAQGFHDFLRTARLCVEVWCYWIHVGVYNTVETFQHS